jgi:tetratricopeptide (TPR) repeat protein
LTEVPAFLRVSGIWMLIGGIITLISPMMLIYDSRIDTVIGIVLTLIFILFASFEIGASRVSFKGEIGGWNGVVNALLIALLARVIMIFLARDWYFYANAIMGVGELGLLLVIYRRKDLFMPPAEEIEKTLKRLASPTVKVASECPTCHEVVEINWESCPYCGTKLMKHCGNCGIELEETVAICPNCGTPIESIEAITRTIESLNQSIQELDSPETRASQYAKLGENLLKTGDNDGALDAYTEAIKNTEFTRKRSYFMVKMARILKNIGKENEALEILDTAMELDPEDYAGAAEMKQAILSPSPKEEESKGAPQSS